MSPSLSEHEQYELLEHIDSAPMLDGAVLLERTRELSLHALSMALLWDHNVQAHQKRLEQTLDPKRYEAYIHPKQAHLSVNPWERWFPVKTSIAAPIVDDSSNAGQTPMDLGSQKGTQLSAFLSADPWVHQYLSALVVSLKVPLQPERGNVLGWFWKKPKSIYERQQDSKVPERVQEAQTMSTQQLWQHALEGIPSERVQKYREYLDAYERFCQHEQALGTLRAGGAKSTAEQQHRPKSGGALHMGVFANPIAAYAVLDLSDSEWRMAMQMSCPVALSESVLGDNINLSYSAPKVQEHEQHIPISHTERKLSRLRRSIKALYWLGAVDSTPLSGFERFTQRLMRRKELTRSVIMDMVTSDVYFEQAAWLVQQVDEHKKARLSVGQQGVKEQEDPVLASALHQIQGVRTRERNKVFSLSATVMGAGAVNAFAGLLGAHAKAIISGVIHPALLGLVVPYMGYKMLRMDKVKPTKTHLQIAAHLEKVYQVRLESSLVNYMQNAFSLRREPDKYHLLHSALQLSSAGVLKMLMDCPAPNTLGKWLSSPSEQGLEETIKQMQKEAPAAKAWCLQNGASLGWSSVWAQEFERQFKGYVQQGSSTNGAQSVKVDRMWLFQAAQAHERVFEDDTLKRWGSGYPWTWGGLRSGSPQQLNTDEGGTQMQQLRMQLRTPNCTMEQWLGFKARQFECAYLEQVAKVSDAMLGAPKKTLRL